MRNAPSANGGSPAWAAQGRALAGLFAVPRFGGAAGAP